MSTSIVLISHELDGNLIQQRELDGYIHATAMCKACGKQLGHYFENASTKAFLEALSLDMGILIPKLMIIRKGKPSHLQGTWVHPEVATHLRQWLSTARVKESTEQTVQKQLNDEIGGKMEVSIPPGKIDILTNSQIIEVKLVKNWMKGVGQLMIYGQHFPNHEKRLHLFGKAKNSIKKMIETHCNSLKIKVTWYNS